MKKLIQKKFLIIIKDGIFKTLGYPLNEENITIPEGYKVFHEHIINEEVDYKYNNYVLFEAIWPDKPIKEGEVESVELIYTIINSEDDLKISKWDMLNSALIKIHGEYNLSEQGIIKPIKEEFTEEGYLIRYIFLGFVEI